MNREDIKRLAHESGLMDWFNGPSLDYLEFIHCLNDFAALVAAAERERMVADGWRRCAVGQKVTQHCGLAEEAVAAAIRARGDVPHGTQGELSD